MDKKAYLEETYNSAFKDEFEKISGVYSEFFGQISPLGILGSIPGSIAAAFTPTKTKKEMVEQQKKTWSNLLVPGAAAYRYFKRLGYSSGEKMTPLVTEGLAGLNLLNKFTGGPASIAAAVSPTLTKKQMDKMNKKSFSNVLIPGVGTYRGWKRLGYTQKELNKAVKEQKSNKK